MRQYDQQPAAYQFETYNHEAQVEFFRHEYGAIDPALRLGLVELIGEPLGEHVRQLDNFGITKLRPFDSQHIDQMQTDMTAWLSTKQWNADKHMGFDGNSGESYLASSRAISQAITDPTIWSVVTAGLGQHPRLSSYRAYSIDPIEPYSRRAFQWHHDGHSEIGYRVMLLLSDVPDHGQAMQLCPGTNQHRWPTESSRQTQFDDEFAAAFESYVCSGQAGDVFVFNPHCLHRGTRNLTVRRDVVVANFQPGMARNYPLPGLHPDVASSLSDYQQAVYRVGSETARLAPATDFITDTRADRLIMAELAARWQPPTWEIKKSLRLAPERLIDTTGAANVVRLRQASGVRYAESVTPDMAMQVRSEVAAAADVLTRLLVSSESQTAISSIIPDLRVAWRSDLHADLDLPVRMYHPNRDQRRDNAITQTRDHENNPLFNEIDKAIDGLSPADILGTSPEDFPWAADALWVVAHQASDTAFGDANLCLTEDLEVMLKRAHSWAHIRRTLLFTFLTAANIHDICQAGAKEVDIVAEAAYHKQQTLQMYLAFLVLDMMHGEQAVR